MGMTLTAALTVVRYILGSTQAIVGIGLYRRGHE
jgi:hypothetical protein